ncbi:hypothetical protein LguiA_021865 [Lonicera macranthoides]
MAVLTLPFSYLGVPIFKGKPSKRHLQAYFDVIKSKIEGWKSATLSMVGRLQLVNSVIHSKLLYSFAVYLWPIVLLMQLDQAIRNFIWTSRCDKKKLVAPSLADMCRSLKEEGNGLRSLKAMNKASLVKTTCNLLVDDNELYQFVKCNVKLTSGGGRFRHIKSSVMAGLKAVVPIIFVNAHWWVSSGVKIDFLNAQWLRRALVDLLNLPACVAIKLMSSISDFLVDGYWCLPQSFKAVFLQIVAQIEGVELYNGGTL